MVHDTAYTHKVEAERAEGLPKFKSEEYIENWRVGKFTQPDTFDIPFHKECRFEPIHFRYPNDHELHTGTEMLDIHNS